jgi:transcriptional regulator with XRE-family HTH domain
MSLSTAGMSQGERIRYWRERAGLTQEVVSGLAGHGPQWLRPIEAGRRRLRDVGELAKLARVLGVGDLAAIGPEDMPAVPVDGLGVTRQYHPAIGAIREVVRGILFAPLPETPPDLDDLAAQVRQAWVIWHTSATQRTDVGAVLPSLLRAVHAAARMYDGQQRRRAYAIMTNVYHLAQWMAAYASEPELYWTLADRGLTAAREADDPTSLAGAAWWLSVGQRSAGYTDDALRTALDAIRLLRPHLEGGDDDARGVYGQLHLHAAIIHARSGQEGEAWQHWDAADEVAMRLPDGYWHYWSMFSRANVAIFGMSVAADLAHGGTVISRAETLDPSTVPSVERRTRLWTELARGHEQRRDIVAALAIMEEAVACSAEAVQYTPMSRELVIGLQRQRTVAMGERARRLAEQIGVAA